MDVIGEWWTPMILRDLLIGVTRFEDLRRDLGIASNVLADRLATLTKRGVVERRRYQANPARFEYILTEKGRDILPALAALLRWGRQVGVRGQRGTRPARSPGLRQSHDAARRVRPLPPRTVGRQRHRCGRTGRPGRLRYYRDCPDPRRARHRPWTARAESGRFAQVAVPFFSSLTRAPEKHGRTAAERRAAARTHVGDVACTRRRSANGAGHR